MFTASPGFDPKVIPLPYVMEGRRGEAAKNAAVYDLGLRRKIDSQLIERACDFMQRSVTAGKPFFSYIPLTQLHYPTLPHRDFEGRTGAGDFADSMAEMDHNVSQVIVFIEQLGIRENTVLIFASDNGPEFRRPWRGTAGPWSGTYHTAMEGALRVPFMLRWPGRVPPGKVSDEIVHVTDLYTTLSRIAGARVPDDRPIDGVDQLDFFTGKQPKSNREGFVYYIKQELRAAKWRDWKLHIVWEPEPNTGPNHLETPWLFNLTRDPKEETDVGTEYSWARRPLRVLIEEFQASLKKNPPIPPGAPDDYQPGKS
jgi:arylsulfatase